MATARSRASRKYNEKTYERITFVVYKGERACIKAAADAAGQSANEYIREAVATRMHAEGAELVREADGEN